MAFYLTRHAIADLKDIGRYTAQQWGIHQRNIYLTLLDRAFHDLSSAPDLGRSCDYIRVGYRKYQVGKHVVFFRCIKQGEIEVVRVLHERMDVKTHLG